MIGVIELMMQLFGTETGNGGFRYGGDDHSTNDESECGCYN